MIRKILLISIIFNCFLFASHRDISKQEWENSQSKIKFEKKLNYIVSATKKPIYQLRLDLLENIITPLIDTQEIKAVIITDNFSEIPFLTAYKEKNKTNISLDKKEKQLDKSLYFILESKIIYENIHIANVILYIYKSKINLQNRKDQVIAINLSNEEILYLEERKVLKVCTIPNALPYEKIDENNKHIGFFSDILQLIEKSININIVIVQTESFTQSLSYIKEEKCDILTGAMKTPDREKFLNFTNPYLTESLVIATNKNKIFINSAKELYHKKVGIIQGYAFLKLLKTKYPDIYFEEVKNVMDGLKKTNNNELFAFIDTFPIIAYNIQKNLFTNIKISGKLEEYIEFRTASRLDEKILNSILQKAHNAISKNTKESLLKKWLDIKIEQTINFKYLNEIILIFTIIILTTLFWTKKLSNTNKKLKQTSNDLKLEHETAMKYASELQETLKKLEDSNKKLEILASIDSMTGLFNRGYFEKISVHNLSLAKRNKTSVSVILLDIDNFKNINDTYGHPIGDKVIISLAKNIKKLHRKSDLLCRLGGEEFIMLLPNTNMKNALLLAENIRQEIEDIKVKIENDKIINFTVSIGVSCIHVEKEDSIENSIKRADDALYKAKRSGKNKVCVKY